MLRSWLLTSLLSFCLLDSLLGAGAVATNRTIDDSFGDSTTGVKPIYLPSTPAGVWHNQTCTVCATKPPTQLAFMNTWTSATYHTSLKSISIELNFKGTAVYVFFILANYVASGVYTETACNFTLDGSPAGSFSHTPTSSTQFEYNALVFSNKNLQNEDHKLIIETNDVNHPVYINFDYAIYTTDDTVTSSSASNPAATASSDSTSSGSKTNVGAIAGGVVGGVVALAAIIGGLLFCLRRRRREFEVANKLPPHSNLYTSVDPFNASEPAIAGQPGDLPLTPMMGAIAGSEYSTIPTGRGPTSPSTSSNPDSPYGGVVEAFTQSHPTQPALRKPPLRFAENGPRTSTSEETSTTRQQELDNQLHAIEEQRRILAGNVDEKSLGQPTSETSQDQEMQRMRDQIRVMSDQIQLLQSQRASEWAQGLTDEPPPGYTPSTYRNS